MYRALYSEIYMILPTTAGKFIYISRNISKSYIFKKIYMILPAVAGKKGYISYIWGLVGLNTAI